MDKARHTDTPFTWARLIGRVGVGKSMVQPDQIEKEVTKFIRNSGIKFGQRTLNNKRWIRSWPFELTTLPRSDTLHFRGFLSEGQTLWGRQSWTPEMLFPPEPGAQKFDPYFGSILCHTKPLRDRYVDIPDRWDIYMLLRYKLVHFGFAGKNAVAKITRTEKTWPTILKLRDWEESHPYRVNRLKALYSKAPSYEIEQRYAESAIRAIGLEWPGKPNHRKREWPKCFRDIGLEVEILLGPTYLK